MFAALSTLGMFSVEDVNREVLVICAELASRADYSSLIRTQQDTDAPPAT